MEQDAMNTQEFYFARDSRSVYFKNKKLNNADPASFKVMGLGYALDNNVVYYRDTVVIGADSKTFEVYAHGYGETDAKDGQYEYLEGIRMKK